MANFRTIVVGPRSAGIGSYIKDECFKARLQVKLEAEPYGWWREKVRIEIEGDQAQIDRVIAKMQKAMAAFNEQEA